MILPAKPRDETLCLESLWHCDVPDSAPKAETEDLCALAAQICDTPFAVVSLVEQSSQWLVASVGWPAGEAPRSISFCGHVFGQRDLLVVPDVDLDPRFSGDPLAIGEPYIKSFAGMPLTAADGQILGVLAVMDRCARHLGSGQLAGLRVLARQVLAQLELRQHKRILSEREERWRFALEGADMGVWDWDMQAPEVYHSDRWCTSLGYEPGEITNRLVEWSSRIHPDDLESAQARIREHLEGRAPLYESEHRMRARDGTWRWIFDRGKVTARDLEGRPLRMVGAHLDITDRKLAELNGIKLASIVESSDDAIIGKDLDGIITSWNQGAQAIFGYAASEMIGSSIARLIPLDRKEEEEYLLGRVRQGEKIIRFETRRQNKAGGVIDVSLTVSPIRNALGQIVGASKIARDITASKRIELELQASRAALQRSEERWQFALQGTDLGVWDSFVQTGLVFYSDRWCTMLGYQPAEISHRYEEWVSRIHPDDVEPTLARLQDHLAGLTEQYETEHRLRTKAGTYHWILARGKVMERDTFGRPIRVVGTHTDIAKRKQDEQALLDSQELLRIATEHARVGLVVVGKDRRYRFANHACSEFIGRPLSAIIGHLGAEVLADVYEEHARPGLDRAFAGESVAFEVAKPSAFGVRHLAVAYEPRMESGEVTMVVGVVTDVTERKRAAAVLEESEERFRLVTEHARVGLVIVDRDRRYVFANKAHAENLGLSESILVGQRVSKVLNEIYEEQIRSPLDRAFNGERVFNELHKPSTDGERYFSAILEPILAAGTVQAVVVVQTEVTARKRAEIALQESTRFAHATIDALPAHICVLDTDGTILATNAAWRQFAKHNAGDPDGLLAGANYLRACDEAHGRGDGDAARFAAGIRAVLAGDREEYALEYPCHSPCEQRWFVGRVTRFHGAGPIRVVVAHENITQRILAEEALQLQQKYAHCLLRLSRKLERAEDFSAILHAAREAVQSILGFTVVWFYLLSDDGKYLRLIQADEAMPRAETPDDGRLLLVEGDAMLEEIAASREIVVVEDARTDPRTNKAIVERLGNRTIVNVPVVLAGRKIGSIGTGSFGAESVRPLSAAEREFVFALASHVAAVMDRVSAAEAKLSAEAALRASEEWLRTVTDAAQVGLVIVDADHCYRYANPAYARILGLKSHAIVGLRVAEVLPSLYEGQIRPRLARALRGERITYELTVPPPSTGGSAKHFAVAYEPGADSAKPVVVVVIVDITERKQAEIAMQESEERFRQLAENINEVFWMLDPASGAVLYVSPAFEKIWGQSCRSLQENPRAWLDAVHPEHRSRVAAALKNNPISGGYDETYPITRPDGSSRWIHDRAFPIRNSIGEMYRIVGTAEDITARRQLEEQFRQSQKMEAIGQLAGGVAHDFNNILSAILMQTELTELPESTREEIQDGLREIRTLAERAANLTRQLLLFSRKQVMHSRDLDLNEVVGSLSKMLRRILSEDLRLEFKLYPAPLIVRADAGMLDQVLMNLVVNARDATPAGGGITISTGVKHFTAEEAASIPEAKPGRHVFVTVADTGCGIAPEVRAHIFEPFFTTKEPGKGTGLGLAITFGIVKQHHGWVQLDSEAGCGAAFNIFLPVAEVTDLGEKVDTSSRKIDGGTEAILLVEDELSVRKLTGTVLRRAGYKVFEAANGIEALGIFEKHQEAIRLMFTDIVMPEGISGRDLAASLQVRNPRLRVIFSSGYSADIAGRELKLKPGQNFIPKPAATQQILEIVRRSLDG